MQLQFYSDADGVPRALCEGPGRTVAGFLESDLQDSTAAAHEVLRALDEVAAGRAASWERTGNAYTLTLSADGASLQDELDDEAQPYALSLPELRDVVASWVSFLENGRRS
jgi:uncharacterized protein YacL (UPF0231 family)